MNEKKDVVITEINITFGNIVELLIKLCFAVIVVGGLLAVCVWSVFLIIGGL